MLPRETIVVHTTLVPALLQSTREIVGESDATLKVDTSLTSMAAETM